MEAWQRPYWDDIRGASLRDGHPAPFPAELSERLIRMFSFAGDTVLDPFGGTGSTSIGAIRTGRNSIMYEIEDQYVRQATKRVISALNANKLSGPRQQSLFLHDA
jgi:site-specific DNA-methyltransferase (adenine-specific)